MFCKYVRRICLATISIIFVLSLSLGCKAENMQKTMCDVPPVEVVNYVAQYYPNWEIEDYICVSGTPKGDFGFVLVACANERSLIGFKEADSKMVKWMSNSEAVPQGRGYVYFRKHDPGMHVSPGNTEARYVDSWGFDIAKHDEGVIEYWTECVSFHWEGGAFLLQRYMNSDISSEQAHFANSYINFYDIYNGEFSGRISFDLNRDVRQLNIDLIPMESQDRLPSLNATNYLFEREILGETAFRLNEKYPVYSGPYYGCLRGAQGKAAVSTNGEIIIYGIEDEYIFIQYTISSQQHRFGYITASALNIDSEINSLEWLWQSGWTNKTIDLTDDPFYSQTNLMSLASNTEVTILGFIDDWAYVEVIEGTWVRGFIPKDSINYVNVYQLEELTNGTLAGTVEVEPNGRRIMADFFIVDKALVPIIDSFLIVDGQDRVILQVTSGNAYYDGYFYSEKNVCLHDGELFLIAATCNDSANDHVNIEEPYCLKWKIE